MKFCFFISLLYLFFSSLASFARDHPPSLVKAEFNSQVVCFQTPNNEEIFFTREYTRDLGQENFSWYGKNPDQKNSFLSFTRIRGQIFGTVKTTDHQTFHFQNEGEKILFTAASKKILSCGGCQQENGYMPVDPRTQRRAKNWRNGDNNLIDLMVAYTADAMKIETFNLSTMQYEQQFESEDELRAYVENAISESNLCFLNSKVNAAIRLVHLVEIDYAETQDPSMDLNRSTNPTDGYLDQLHTLRDQYGADLVSVLISEGDGKLGGIANAMSYPSLDFGEKGFNVVVIGQIGAPSYSLLHEIGHNMGCLHNREDAMNRGVPDTDPSNTSVFKEFNYGKRWITNGQGFRTIMAYDTDGTPTYSNRIPYFSNPNTAYQGILTGNLDSEDNAQVLNTTTPYVSNFRSSIVQGIVPSIYSLNISEGNASSFSVRLASKPESNVSISISLDSAGDQDFSLLGSSTMTFSPESWNLPQPLQLISKKDADASNGISTIYLSSTGIPSTSVVLNEIETGTGATSHRLITGVIKDSQGVGVPNVSLSFSSEGTPILTDENGTFFTSVSSTWSGTITPSKAGHQFSPDTLSISSDTAETIQEVFLASRSQILYVDATATGNGDGSTWANAYPELSTALQSMHPFNEVWVASGTYKPGVFRSDFFLLPPNVSIYGGFSGSEHSRQERNSTTNQTILSGDIGNINDGSDNTFHVVVPSNGSHLEGFIIQDGNASENYSDSRGKGAGLHAEGVNFSFSNCIIRMNKARQNGGAAYLLDTNATFSNCTFSNNLATSGGAGAAYLLDTNATFSNCTFLSNLATSGGALDIIDSNVTILDSNFSGNQSDYAGGAIAALNSIIRVNAGTFSLNQINLNNGGGAINAEYGSLILTDCTFNQNQATLDGGAIDAEKIDLNTTNCVFTNNRNSMNNGGGAIALSYGVWSDLNSSYNDNYSASSGGALDIADSNVTIMDSNFSKNQSMYRGGSIKIVDSNLSIIKSYFTDHVAGSNGGAINITSSELFIGESVFRENHSDYWGGSILANTSTVKISNSQIIENNASTGGSINCTDSNFTIMDSNFSGNQSDYAGGAIAAVNSNIKVSAGTFSLNQVNLNNGGGAINAEYGSLILSDCTFNQNLATLAGGAIYAEKLDLNTTNCNFTNNRNSINNGGGAIALSYGVWSDLNGSYSNNYSASSGGALDIADSNVTIQKSYFVENRSDYNGGAIYHSGGNLSSFDNSFIRNYASQGGGVYCNQSTSLIFGNNSFIANETSIMGTGGALFINDVNNQVQITNSLLHSNKASVCGVISPSVSTLFTNCTLTQNNASAFGSIAGLFEGQFIDFQNSILWNNSDDTLKTEIFLIGGSVNLQNCIFNPDHSLTSLTTSNILNLDPLFIDINGSDGIAGNEDDDYNLQSTSPAIDQASAGARYYSTTDILGKTRYGNGPDIGAFEYRVNSVPVMGSGSALSISSNEDETASYTFTASDIDGDDLTWSISSPANNGTISISQDSGLASYQPNLNWYGIDSFSVSVSDGASIATVTVSVSVASVDDPPVLSAAIPDQSMNEDQGNLNIDLSEFFSDSDSLENLTFSATSSDESLVIPTTSGSDLVLSLLSNQFGTSIISINATSGSQSVSDSFILEVQSVNDPPTLSNSPAGGTISISESSTYLFDFNATDYDGDSLTFILSGSDSSFFEVNASSGVIRFKEAPDFETPLDSDQNNSYELSIVVSDQSSSSQPYSLLVSIIDLDEYAWSTAVDHGNHWRSTDWFGTYFETSSNWIFHVNHGWLYRSGTSMSSFWLYDSNLDWLWTNFENYPYLFRSESGAWIFFQNDSGSRKFYDYSTNSWTTLPAN